MPLSNLLAPAPQQQQSPDYSAMNQSYMSPQQLARYMAAKRGNAVGAGLSQGAARADARTSAAAERAEKVRHDAMRGAGQFGWLRTLDGTKRRTAFLCLRSSGIERLSHWSTRRTH